MKTTRKYYVDKITEVIVEGWSYRCIEVAEVVAETPQKAWKMIKDKLEKGQYHVSIHNGTASRKIFIKE